MKNKALKNMLNSITHISEPTGETLEGTFACQARNDFKDKAKDYTKHYRNYLSNKLEFLPENSEDAETIRYELVIAKQMDEEQGTDLYLYDCYNIDITHSFNTKDNMPYICETDVPATPLTNFWIGIRTGNSMHGFKNPVAVIGFDHTSDQYKRYSNMITDHVCDYAEKLCKLAMDRIDEFNYLYGPDPDPEDYGGERLLMPNPDYSPDKKEAALKKLIDAKNKSSQPNSESESKDSVEKKDGLDK